MAMLRAKISKDLLARVRSSRDENTTDAEMIEKAVRQAFRDVETVHWNDKSDEATITFADTALIEDLISNGLDRINDMTLEGFFG